MASNSPIFQVGRKGKAKKIPPGSFMAAVMNLDKFFNPAGTNSGEASQTAYV